MKRYSLACMALCLVSMQNNAMEEEQKGKTYSLDYVAALQGYVKSIETIHCKNGLNEQSLDFLRDQKDYLYRTLENMPIVKKFGDDAEMVHGLSKYVPYAWSAFCLESGRDVYTETSEEVVKAMGVLTVLGTYHHAKARKESTQKIFDIQLRADLEKRKQSKQKRDLLKNKEGRKRSSSVRSIYRNLEDELEG